jgi:D-alanine-D-alanine ligase
MRIAFTFNLQMSPTEAEAEFDTPATVAFIGEALARLGHEVELIDVSGPVSSLIARLEAFAPDLVFNTAEGDRGRSREGFYPALFEQLGLAFTGSDAHTCIVTLDKHLSKRLARDAGVKTPGWALVTDAAELAGLDLAFPVIAKPNFEGSSIGITGDSIVDTEAQLVRLVSDLVTRFPDGILVEEFITGRDVVVPYLAAASPATGGVLEPASYAYTGGGARPIYDYDLKIRGFGGLVVELPATITAAQREAAMAETRRLVGALRIRDLARVDFRLSPEGELYFLEINALPSLEAGASIYGGAPTPDAVVAAIVSSAAARYGLSDPTWQPTSKGNGHARAI